MRRWPTVEQLAAASEDEVLREWQGLGYYSRARNLHYAARQIVAMGGFPTTYEGIRQLKGVGDYTAAAIGSLAFDLPLAVVDGNVYRVLSRHFGISTPINTTEGKKEFAQLAQELLPSPSTHHPTPSTHHPSPNTHHPSPNTHHPTPNTHHPTPSTYNQAIMDFGATLCTPQSPRCEECPLQESCVALREGKVSELPVKLKTLKVKERHLTYIYIRCKGFTAIHRRGEGDIWQGLYEPLIIEHSPQNNVQCSMFNVQLIKRNVKHVLTHRILWADFYLWETDERPTLPDDYFWIREEDIDQYAVPRLVERLLELKY